MIELPIIVVLLAAIVWVMRGKTFLEAPVVLHQPGQYHITLAPRLQSAQSFIQGIVRAFPADNRGSCTTHYYEIHDPALSADSSKRRYLLAASLRSGMFYFQAIDPQPLLADDATHLDTIRKFSDAVMRLTPLAGAADAQVAEKLDVAIQLAAQNCKLEAVAIKTD